MSYSLGVWNNNMFHGTPAATRGFPFNYTGDGSGRQDQNIDMQGNFETGWPDARLTSGEKNTNWHHSDFDYIAYPFTHSLFDKIVTAGNLK